MPIKLIIFDLDGTLIDSIVDISNALNHAIGLYGLSKVTVEETKKLVGEGVVALIDKLVMEKAPGLEVPTLMKRFLAYYTGHLSDYTVPFPGTAEVLRALAPRRRAVVSNKLESFTLELLKTVNLLDLFDYVAGGDTGAEKKPSPQPILNVLSRFDVQPREALMVGDSIFDMMAGRAAGVRTVAALYGYGPPDFADGADYSIRRISDLPDIVRRAEEEPA